jgi:predicted metal-dependent phosphoesterase TrpH
MIDLHSHTNQSDGSFSAPELVGAAVQAGLEALAITDHDTFAGYDLAVPHAAEAGLDLVCGIELSTKYHGQSVHLLGYFLHGGPPPEFRAWITALQTGRHLRNRQLVDLLRSKGFEITLEEVYRRGGNLPGRPHFAALLVEKGYVPTLQKAFDDYLDASASCYVQRDEPAFAEGVTRIAAAAGLPSLPHPGRVSKEPRQLEEIVLDMRNLGLQGIEAYHSDHTDQDIECYLALAQRLSLAVSGGSDFHGSTKPGVSLGTGIQGKLNVPREVLLRLRELSKNGTLGTRREPVAAGPPPVSSD